MVGMMISMTNSMMASIAIGTILGTLIQNKDLTIPTIVSVLIGMIVGYLTGIPVSLMAALDGLTAGVMGGMMGSMLGVMLQPKFTEIMIYFVDVVLMGAFVFGKGTFLSTNSEQASNEVEKIKFNPTSSQIYEVMVTPTAYTPNNLVVKAGTPFIINFKTERVGCTGIILSDELGFNIALKANTNNYINVKSLKPGTFHYACGMNMYKGTITAVK
ncbi:hypothetical protein C0971_02330 [Bacillus methanolicus]|uniref:cupredoxin domain-containing protein n=1 Tax=Bacillus methanolicus TaxID=1471 RepID=UPI00200FDBC8|nr:cupredoxin domain-containing protein [Bacillus methanolicus]UQD51000.1 hypothetical protein C0971_02330 [Bacillus methanolicus]